MARIGLYILFSILTVSETTNLDYLDPTKLQTVTTANIQQLAATELIGSFIDKRRVIIQVNPELFSDNKDVFSLSTFEGKLYINASTGVAAAWGFNYYLKKYIKSHVSWQVSRVDIPASLPEVEETVVANDRFRYYQNVCTASYSFAWWNVYQWKRHVKWMALNGINLVLAPFAQEDTWARVYLQLGMTDEEIDQHFTGPAFLAWLRMGNVRGWGGPLPKKWHTSQRLIQDRVIDYMYRLGIVPVFPAFNGHVPKAFARIFPQSHFYEVDQWNQFSSEYCCGLFLNPSDALFKTVGDMFLKEATVGNNLSHIYTVDPFNELKIKNWSSNFIQEVARSVYTTLTQFDSKAVWLLQNWMFVHDPLLWPKERVKTFLTSVPKGRMLVLDLQSEQWPQYDIYEMYYGQPFIWCMLHNFGGTLGMFGNMIAINSEVYSARSRANGSMIGIGLTPEGINQNYVVYELMLETAWRKTPVDLESWAAEYAERRYGCNATSSAWSHLIRSVYNFNGLNRMRGKYVVTRRPSFKIRPWAWYKSFDLFESFRKFVLAMDKGCNSDGFHYDLVDVTRQALQYRAEQLYLVLKNNRYSNTWIFNASISQFLDVMNDMDLILSTNDYFRAGDWFDSARLFGNTKIEKYWYELNARYQITLWGPNGEITDYACKQWAGMFFSYYVPRWSMFLTAALDAKSKGEIFDEDQAQDIVRRTVELPFVTNPNVNTIESLFDTRASALIMYKKWGSIANLPDLQQRIIKPVPGTRTTMMEIDEGEDTSPSIIMLPTTPVR